jgi:hypothetical protein
VYTKNGEDVRESDGKSPLQIMMTLSHGLEAAAVTAAAARKDYSISSSSHIFVGILKLVPECARCRSLLPDKN